MDGTTVYLNMVSKRSNASQTGHWLQCTVSLESDFQRDRALNRKKSGERRGSTLFLIALSCLAPRDLTRLGLVGPGGVSWQQITVDCEVSGACPWLIWQSDQDQAIGPVSHGNDKQSVNWDSIEVIERSS
jgi:hypothetical protein